MTILPECYIHIMYYIVIKLTERSCKSHTSLPSALGEEDGVLEQDLEAVNGRGFLGGPGGLPLGAADRHHPRLQLQQESGLVKCDDTYLHN